MVKKIEDLDAKIVELETAAETEKTEVQGAFTDFGVAIDGLKKRIVELEGVTPADFEVQVAALEAVRQRIANISQPAVVEPPPVE